MELEGVGFWDLAPIAGGTPAFPAGRSLGARASRSRAKGDALLGDLWDSAPDKNLPLYGVQEWGIHFAPRLFSWNIHPFPSPPRTQGGSGGIGSHLLSKRAEGNLIDGNPHRQDWRHPSLK